MSEHDRHWAHECPTCESYNCKVRDKFCHKCQKTGCEALHNHWEWATTPPDSPKEAIEKCKKYDEQMTEKFKEKGYEHRSLDFETGRSIVPRNHDLSREEFEELMWRGNNVAIPTCVGDWEGKEEEEKEGPEAGETAENLQPESTTEEGAPGLWPDGPLDPEKWTRAMMVAPVRSEHVETKLADQTLQLSTEDSSNQQVEEGTERQSPEERYRARLRAMSYKRAMAAAERSGWEPES